MHNVVPQTNSPECVSSGASSEVRQQLSHTLYQHDAACRVIARVMKQRDEARSQVVFLGSSR